MVTSTLALARRARAGDGDAAASAPNPDEPRASWVGPLGALGVTGVLIGVSFAVGDRLLEDGIHLQQHLPPLTGFDDWRPGRTALPAVMVGLVGVVAFPVWARRRSWPAVLTGAAVAALAWSVALALVDGTDALTSPLLSNQYLRSVGLVGDPHTFLSGFVTHIGEYNIHTRGHPPGFVMILWALDAIGLGGVDWNAVVVFLGGTAGVVAALVAARDVVGEQLARRAAPFVALAPVAIWWTSGDAFFSGVSLTAVACLVLATSARGRRSDVLAVVGGALMVATAYLSYGLVLFAFVPVAVATHRRRLRPLVVAGTIGLALVAAITLLSGFVWWDGLAATRVQYFRGVASRRPYEYYVFGDLAVFAIAVGPAAIAGLGRLRGSRAALLVGAALAVVLAADLSGMSKAEVERIWIPFVPLVTVAAATMARTVRTSRWWLSAQVAVTLLIAVGVRSPW